MTWALAKVCKVFAMAVALRNSLKLLKGLSSKKKTLTEAGYGVLMFWAIFGFFILWEQYFEYFVRWVPTYYYLKSFFIVLMAYPQLRFTNYIFVNVIVYAIDCIHNSFGDWHHLSAADVAFMIPLNVAMFIFPLHLSKPTIIETTNGLEPLESDDNFLSIDLTACFDNNDEDHCTSPLPLASNSHISSSIDSATDLMTQETVDSNHRYVKDRDEYNTAAPMSHVTPPSHRRTKPLTKEGLTSAWTPPQHAPAEASACSPDKEVPSLSSDRHMGGARGGGSSMYRRGSSLVIGGVRGVRHLYDVFLFNNGLYIALLLKK